MIVIIWTMDCAESYIGAVEVKAIGRKFHGQEICNLTRCAEQNVEWVADCLRYMRDNNYARIGATQEAEEAWTEHVNELPLVPSCPRSTPGSWTRIFRARNGELPYRGKVEIPVL